MNYIWCSITHALKLFCLEDCQCQHSGPSMKDQVQKILLLEVELLGSLHAPNLERRKLKISVAPSTLRDFAQMPISVDIRPQQQEFQVPISVDTRPQALSCPGCSISVPFQNPGGPLPVSLVSLPLPMLWACGHATRRLNVPTP